MIDKLFLFRYKFIVVDIISTKQFGDVTVLFVITADGLLKKFAILSTKARLVEIVSIAPLKDNLDVTGVQLVKEMVQTVYLKNVHSTKNILG